MPADLGTEVLNTMRSFYLVFEISETEGNKSIFQINLRAQNKKDDSVCSSKMSQVAINLKSIDHYNLNIHNRLNRNGYLHITVAGIASKEEL